MPNKKTLREDCKDRVCPFPQYAFLPSLPSSPEAALKELHSSHNSTVLQLGLMAPLTPCLSPQVASPQSNYFCQQSTSVSVEIAEIIPVMSIPSEDALESLDSFDISFDISLEEFEKRYVPLSHFPTPPLSDISSVDVRYQTDEDGLYDPEFWGPAKHLAEMVPRNAARNAPSVILLAEILQRAGLRLGVVSLACCVLDCLSDWFIRHWKLECCKIGEGFPERGEILAIAALAISMKFLEDASYSNKVWTNHICENLFSICSLNTAERLALSDMNYSLLSIATPKLLDWNIAEMKRWAAMVPVPNTSSPDGECFSSSAGVLSSKTLFPLLSSKS